MSTTSIPTSVKRELWFKAHGRCEFNGCNKRLDIHGVTFDKCNLSNAAHIIADSPLGPRGDIKESAELAKDESNLMLMCSECHKYIDNEGVHKYSAEQLRLMKKQHEERIEMLVGIGPDMKSLVVLYGANIGNDTAMICESDIHSAILPDRYPAYNKPISIELKNSYFKDHNTNYWEIETEQIVNKCRLDVFRRMLDEQINHISLFALAPQPLLVKLGTILNDKYNVDVYQKHREPDTWVWQNEVEENPIRIIAPSDKTKVPAMVFALSSDTIIERIKKRFGEESSIWTITCTNPNNDMLKSKKQVANFRSQIRKLINEIETASDYDNLKIFMALPVAMAVELGRIRMEKASMKWVLYDYNRELDGDIETITISRNE